MNRQTGVWLGTALSLLLASAAQAALLERLDGQAYYDTDLDITWLANANLARSESFGISGSINNGAMDWNTANEWIAAMNAVDDGKGYLGYNDWRLPKSLDTGAPGCNFAYSGTDCGYNVDLSVSEMAHLYYVELGNLARYDIDGVTNSCYTHTAGCMTNQGPFVDLWYINTYWSTSYETSPNFAWVFNFEDGRQNYLIKSQRYPLLPVRDGDVLVPIPGAVWLLGSALGVLGIARRRMAAGGEA